jgi:hypothetical protein
MKFFVLTVSLIALIGCSSPLGPQVNSPSGSGKFVTNKSLVINGSTGVKMTSRAINKSLTGDIDATNGFKVVLADFAAASELVGRSTMPLMSGIAVTGPITDTDVLVYTVFGQDVNVTVSTRYGGDGTVPIGVEYVGVFSDGLSGFTIDTDNAGIFLARQEMLARMENANGDVLRYVYAKANISGTFRADGGFDATGTQTMVDSISWIGYNITDVGTGSLQSTYEDFTVKAGPNGMAILGHASSEYYTPTNTGPYAWVPLSLKSADVAWYVTLTDHANVANNWGWNGCYLPAGGVWSGFLYDNGTPQAQYAALNY